MNQEKKNQMIQNKNQMIQNCARQASEVLYSPKIFIFFFAYYNLEMS